MQRRTRIILLILIIIAVILIVEFAGGDKLFARNFLRNLIRHIF